MLGLRAQPCLELGMIEPCVSRCAAANRDGKQQEVIRKATALQSARNARRSTNDGLDRGTIEPCASRRATPSRAEMQQERKATGLRACSVCAQERVVPVAARLATCQPQSMARRDGTQQEI